MIKGPARRLDGTIRTLKIEDRLVDALLADMEAGGAKDALPLLAFTLERLYDDYHAGGLSSSRTTKNWDGSKARSKRPSNALPRPRTIIRRSQKTGLPA